MNSLGRDVLMCLDGLRDYHRALRGARDRAQPGVHAWRALEPLERVFFSLEVDVEARGGARTPVAPMTAVEREVFLPTLRRVQAVLREIPLEEPPPAWRPHLDAALLVLRHGVRQLHGRPLRRHSRRTVTRSGARRPGDPLPHTGEA
ncbi:MAG TPA: hypothetical protein VMT50_09110 [Steroidobacteraceae bacterium]|nr:hypothetical protein [Steroidobacteraceae bacterium]